MKLMPVSTDAELLASRATQLSTPSTDIPDGHYNPLRRPAQLFAVLCVIGLLVSAELTRIHLFVHTDPSFHSICAVSDELNCETVAGSPYSVALGLPVSVWGLFGYLVMGLLSLWGASRTRLHRTWPWGILLVLTVLSAVVSAILAYISTTQISSFCLFCMASYGINLLLLSVCLFVLKRSAATFTSLLLADVNTLARRRFLSGNLALSAIALIGAAEASVPHYWSTSAWATLPKLDSGTDEAGHHWLGGCKPALTIVEFSDYECPHCRAAHKQIRELAAKYKDEIRLVHRHLPLDQKCHPGLKKPFHEHACVFAEAAECAALQGRFWEMNDALFSAQETAKATDVDPVDLAVRLGLNRAAFKRCLEGHLTLPKVSTDIRAALDRRLEGTPSFLIEDHLYLGSVSETELLTLLRRHVPTEPIFRDFSQGQREFCDGSRQAGGIASAAP